MTGATGFVGLNIVEALLAAGHEVVCYVRPGARRTYLAEMPVRLVRGSLDDAPALAAAMRGTDALIHTAGNTSASWDDIVALREANVDSTRAVLQAARGCGVGRIVYTSTSSTIGSGVHGTQRADESAPLAGWRSRSPYAQTKLAAEALLRGPQDGPACIVLNPAEVIGPYDHSLQWGRMVLAVAAGQLPFVPPGAGTFCPARDVAQAHVAALSHGRHGERYILGGHDVAFADLIARIGTVTGAPVAPHDVRAYAVQRREARRRERLGQPVALDSYRMRVFGQTHCFDDAKARAELGYTTRPLEVAIDECYRWYQSRGFLPAAAAPHDHPNQLDGVAA